MDPRGEMNIPGPHIVNPVADLFVVGDSWFGSVKTAVKLWNVNGLYSNMLVKTAHKDYPRVLLREKKIERGEWVSAVGTIDDTPLMATKFLDL